MATTAALFSLLLLTLATSLALGLAPLEIASDKVEGEYMVLFQTSLTVQDFKSSVGNLADALGSGSLIKTFIIGDSYRAAHLKLDTQEKVDMVRAHHEVQLVAENAKVSINQQTCHQQEDVIWNLARVNERDVDLVNERYHWDYAGEGTEVYVIDTGILTTHVEFGNRAVWGVNTVDSTNVDCNGHGTHVAGTIGGQLHGIAKRSTLIAVKVLGCGGGGTIASVVGGIEWTASEASSRGKPSLANMSLGGGKSAILDGAVAAAVRAGITFAVAAGNSNGDACFFSPAAEPLAITVAATTIVQEPNGEEKDLRSTFSNYGQCVDIAAPGELIKAAWIDRAGSPPNNSYNTISGTSMASPHAAGAISIMLSANPKLSPADVEKHLLGASTNGVIDLNCRNTACEATPNKLLYTNCN